MTKEEIQYEAQSIIQEWGSNDSAPYVEFVEKLASMELPESFSNLDEAANKFAVSYDQGTCDGIAQDCFKAGAEWMAGQFQKIEGDLVDWYSTSEGKDYCCGVKTIDSFEVPEGFYIRKK